MYNLWWVWTDILQTIRWSLTKVSMFEEKGSGHLKKWLNIFTLGDYPWTRLITSLYNWFYFRTNHIFFADRNLLTPVNYIELITPTMTHTLFNTNNDAYTILHQQWRIHHLTPTMTHTPFNTNNDAYTILHQQWRIHHLTPTMTHTPFNTNNDAYTI